MLAAMRAGARGYIVKGSGYAGEAVLGSSAAGTVLSALQPSVLPPDPPFPELTRREDEILQFLAQGQPNSAIADRLLVSEKTVRNHLSIVFDKLDVASHAEAIVLTHRNGID